MYHQNRRHGMSKKIAEQIITQKADYGLAVKENQGTLYEAMKQTFHLAQDLQFKNMVYDQCEEIDSGHGRIETRKCTVLPLMYLHQFKIKWRGLQSLVLIESRREINDQIQMEQRYYINYLPMKANLLMTSVSIGELKIDSIGYWMSSSVKMIRVFVKTMGLKILLLLGI